MHAERWEKVSELYHAARECELSQRSAFLAEACAGDDHLRREVAALLAQDASRDGVLERVAREARLHNPNEGSSGGPAHKAVPDHPFPAAIGRYRILRVVGAGGMGAVYEGEQDHPRRTVALKAIKPGLASPELLRRFEQESQALGRLQHPGIAQIYEAGVAETGYGLQPYFAMEFIHGLSLLEYVKAHDLSARESLEIMAKVCDAADHAHRRGIIHRDLKPSNILVDETGQPKIVDFGVARFTGNDELTRQTSLGELVGTLAYMSPEQVLADSMELDCRSDVYALGVVLYELLTGRLPYDVGRNLTEAVQTIQYSDPAPLRSVNRTYQRDLETISNKSLEKDKQRRYASAADLAADLRHYLADEPILARAPSTGYRIRKFASRHRGLVGTIVVVFIVLLAGIMASTGQAIRARRAEQAALLERDRATIAERSATQERDRALQAEKSASSERVRAEKERNHAVDETRRADAQFAAAKAVSEFLQNDLLAQASARAQAGATTKPDPDLKVRTALDRAAARISSKFDSQPSVEASIRQTIGNAYKELGLFAEAQHQLERAFELRSRVLGPEHRDTLSSMHDLALVYESEGKYAQAEDLLTRVLQVQRRQRGDRHSDTLAALSDLALLAATSQSDHARAETLYAKVLDIQRRVLGEEHPDTLAIMNNLATQYVDRGKYDQAEELYIRALGVKRRVLGEEHPSTLMTMNNLGVLCRDQGKYAKAETLLTAVLDTRRRVMGERHPDTLASMNSLALLYQAESNYERAEQLLAQVLEGRRSVLGEEHAVTLRSIYNLAEINQRRGKFVEAEAMFRRVLDARRRIFGPDHPNTVDVLVSLGWLKLQQHGSAEAEPLLREALSGREKTSPDSWRRYYTQSMLGASLAGLGKFAEAEPLLVSGHAGMMERRSSIPFENQSVLNEVKVWIVQLYRAWGKPSKAAEWQDKNSRVTWPAGTAISTN